MTIEIDGYELIERMGDDEATWAVSWHYCTTEWLHGNYVGWYGPTIVTEVHLWDRSATVFQDRRDGALPPDSICEDLRGYMVARQGAKCQKCWGTGRVCVTYLPDGSASGERDCVDCFGIGEGDERTLPPEELRWAR